MQNQKVRRGLLRLVRLLHVRRPGPIVRLIRNNRRHREVIMPQNLAVVQRPRHRNKLPVDLPRLRDGLRDQRMARVDQGVGGDVVVKACHRRALCFSTTLSNFASTR